MKPDRSEEISRPRVRDTYVEDWSPVPSSRYQGAQAAEKAWWTTQDPLLLMREAQYRFYAGHYEWIKHRALLNPLCVNSSRPANFQIPGEAINGKTFLDIGCGPVPESLSLVHCAQVHVLDPLIGFFKQIQPYGWEFFSSVSASGAEQLSFEDQSVDFVLCRNTLDHTENADKVLREITRVLRRDGELLLNCDLRARRGGGSAHPYKWNLATFQARILTDFQPITKVSLLDPNGTPLTLEESQGMDLLTWISRMRKQETGA